MDDLDRELQALRDELNKYSDSGDGSNALGNDDDSEEYVTIQKPSGKGGVRLTKKGEPDGRAKKRTPAQIKNLENMRLKRMSKLEQKKAYEQEKKKEQERIAEYLKEKELKKQIKEKEKNKRRNYYFSSSSSSEEYRKRKSKSKKNKKKVSSSESGSGSDIFKMDEEKPKKEEPKEEPKKRKSYLEMLEAGEV